MVMVLPLGMEVGYAGLTDTALESGGGEVLDVYMRKGVTQFAPDAGVKST